MWDVKRRRGVLSAPFPRGHARRYNHSVPLPISWPDLKLSVRLLRKYPGLTFVASVGIAVGTGISAGAFAFFYSHLYPKVPLDEGDRIVALENWNVAVNNEDRRVLHDFVTWRDEMTSVVDIGAFRNLSASLQLGAVQGETIRVAEMSTSG